MLLTLYILDDYLCTNEDPLVQQSHQCVIKHEQDQRIDDYWPGEIGLQPEAVWVGPVGLNECSHAKQSEKHKET